MEITLKLNLDEVNGMLNLFGKLPTESNVWPLAAKIRAQAEEQLPKETEGAADGSVGGN
jgi:hypothetical protein